MAAFLRLPPIVIWEASANTPQTRVTDRLFFREQCPSHCRDCGRHSVNPFRRSIARRLRGLAVVAAIGILKPKARGVEAIELALDLGNNINAVDAKGETAMDGAA